MLHNDTDLLIKARKLLFSKDLLGFKLDIFQLIKIKRKVTLNVVSLYFIFSKLKNYTFTWYGLNYIIGI